MKPRTTLLDLDAYVDALPRRTLLPPPTPPARFRTWRWPMSQPYNGFSGVERIRGWQVVRWLEDAGSLIVPTTCDVCGSGDRVSLHSESYYHVDRAPALCGTCHRAMHRRWLDENAWQWLRRHRATPTAMWLERQSRYQIDLARHLRGHWGWDAADLGYSGPSRLPDRVRLLLPEGLLSHPDLLKLGNQAAR